MKFILKQKPKSRAKYDCSFKIYNFFANKMGSVVYTSDEFGLREIHLGHEVDEKGLSEGVLKNEKRRKS